MLLLREMEIEAHPSLGGQLSREEKALYKEAKEGFLNMLDPTLKGKELVRDVYDLADELTSQFLENNQVACHQGCSQCCYQLVCCTTLEMELIVEYMMQSLFREQRRKLVQRIRKEVQWFSNLVRRIETSSPFGLPKRWEMVSEPLKTECLNEKRPCPFLNPKKQTCSIYPVRPIDCRIAKTRDPGCGKEESVLIRKPKSVRLFFDQAGSDLIMEEEARIHGRFMVVPLAAWPGTKRFHQFFYQGLAQ